VRKSLLLTLVLLFAQAAFADAPCEQLVCIEVEQSAHAVGFYAVSKTNGVSVLFSVSAVNMDPASPPPLARRLTQGRTFLMTLKAVRGKKFRYEYAYLWDWGVVDARHDDDIGYRLPYDSGKTFNLYQGPDGALSHQGKAAYDFPMPRGTTVRAARGGWVGHVIDGFGEGGNDKTFTQKANAVMILHDDGTVGVYLHLLRGGIRVKPGDVVSTGDVLALSGNSGLTTGPHLHFEVFRITRGMKRQTVPVRFGADRIELEEGKAYRAE
jgi:murein DD-endopeptidase MepM/ murein hydrolase activator NlpD